MKNVLKLEVDWSETCYSKVYLKDESAEPLRVLAHTGKREEHRWYTMEEGIVEYQGKLWAAMLPDHLDEGCHSGWNDILEGCELELVEVTPEQVMTTQYKTVELPDLPKPWDLVRPSSLPKLAQCRCYLGERTSSPAAERGTRVDKAIRDAWGMDAADLSALAEDERAAVEWALKTLDELCGHGALEVITNEHALHVGVPVCGVATGTMDACCPEGGWLADFKTGQIRGYREQMAAYALGCMLQYGEDEWTAHLLFVDQQQIETIHFTADEAQKIVKEVVAAEYTPRLCEYCGWCAKRDICSVQKEALSQVVQTADTLPELKPALKGNPDAWPSSIRALLSEPETAWQFLRLYGVAKSWAEAISAELKSGTPDERYFKKINVSGTRKALPGRIGDDFLDKLGRDGIKELLAAIPTIDLKAFTEVWKKYEGDRPIPDDLIGTFGGCVQLRLNKQPKTEGAKA